jgi:hypothetical protein
LVSDDSLLLTLALSPLPVSLPGSQANLYQSIQNINEFDTTTMENVSLAIQLSSKSISTLKN